MFSAGTGRHDHRGRPQPEGTGWRSCGPQDHLSSHVIEVVDLDLAECVDLMDEFIPNRPQIWYEDIGVL
jgi:hypothetical protein